MLPRYLNKGDRETLIDSSFGFGDTDARGNVGPGVGPVIAARDEIGLLSVIAAHAQRGHDLTAVVFGIHARMSCFWFLGNSAHGYLGPIQCWKSMAARIAMIAMTTLVQSELSAEPVLWCGPVAIGLWGRRRSYREVGFPASGYRGHVTPA